MSEKYKEKERDFQGGIQKIYHFPNQYGASVVRHWGSYGFKDGLWELAVIKFNKNGSFKLTYNTPITDDVLGYLNEDEIDPILKKIEELEEVIEKRKIEMKK